MMMNVMQHRPLRVSCAEPLPLTSLVESSCTLMWAAVCPQAAYALRCLVLCPQLLGVLSLTATTANAVSGLL